MALQDDLTTLASDLDTLKGIADRLVSAVSDPPPTVADTVLTALVSTLEGAGYTVTPPVTTISVTDGTETPLDTPTE